MARICMGGLGGVDLIPSDALPRWPWHLVVRTSQPVAACLASQYAGWALRHEDGEEKFAALGSGRLAHSPARRRCSPSCRTRRFPTARFWWSSPTLRRRRPCFERSLRIVLSPPTD